MLNRWNNQLSRSRTESDIGLRNKKKKVKGIAENIAGCSKLVASDDDSVIISKVNSYYTPWSVFIHDWMEVFNLRKQDYQDMEYRDLTQKWPILTNVQIAYHLVGIKLSKIQSSQIIITRNSKFVIKACL